MDPGFGYPGRSLTGDARDRDDRGRRDDRDRGRDRDRDRGRERDGGRERERDRDGDRDRRKDDKGERKRSRSRSRGERSSRRTPSRSKSPHPGPRKNRKTKFDILPPGMTPETAAALAPSLIAAAAVPAVAALLPAMGLPGPPPMAGMSLPGMNPNLPQSQQATRHARRVYVGGLPPTANEQSIATFFSHALAAIGGNTAGPGNSVVNVYINREKNFSFVEFRTVEETSNAMALDGIMFEGVSVRVRRPNDYNPTAAVGLGASGPNPNLNLAAIGLGSGGGGAGGGMGGMTTAGGADQAERIFVGGLPYYLTEEQCRELLGSFGVIKSFDLVKDRDTGTGKGYGFVVYADPNVTDIACAGLNGLKMGDRTLTVRRAAEGASSAAGVTLMSVPTSAAAMAAAAAAAVSGVSFPGMGGPGAAIPGATRIVVLADAVTLEEISIEEEYSDILEDMREECSKHGPVENILIPRPLPGNPNPPGLAKVIIVFADMNGSVKARNAMHGRRFAGRTVAASFLSEEAYALGQFDA